MAHQRQCNLTADDLQIFTDWLRENGYHIGETDAGDPLPWEDIPEICREFEAELGAKAPIEKEFDPNAVSRWIQTHCRPWVQGLDYDLESNGPYYCHTPGGSQIEIRFYTGRNRNPGQIEKLWPEVLELHRLIHTHWSSSGDNQKSPHHPSSYYDLACEAGCIDYENDYQSDDYVIV